MAVLHHKSCNDDHRETQGNHEAIPTTHGAFHLQESYGMVIDKCRKTQFNRSINQLLKLWTYGIIGEQASPTLHYVGMMRETWTSRPIIARRLASLKKLFNIYSIDTYYKKGMTWMYYTQ